MTVLSLTDAAHWRRCLLHLAQAVLAAGTIAAGIAVPAAAAPQPANHTSAESLPAPVLTEAMEALRREGEVKPRNFVVRKGETLTSLLARMRIDDDDAVAFIRSTPLLRPLVLPQEGQFVSAGVREGGRLAYLRLYIEGTGEDSGRTIEVSWRGSKFVAEEHPFAFDTIEESVSGAAAGSFERTMRNLEIPDDVAEQLRRVWDPQSGPLANMKRGDSLRIIYERKFADGHFVRDGRLLAAQIVSDDKVSEAYWFSDGDKVSGYYQLDGSSPQQTFMRVPLEVHEVSSEFAALRRHPVTGRLRPHNGTDFRAPAGTRIFAAADGVVTFAGYKRNGYGRYVSIDHGHGITTLYAHMQRIASGLSTGDRVRRGQVIGYVGRSGMATGNHLHYELVRNGVQINPRTADLPDTVSLTPYQTAQLRSAAAPMQTRFDLLAESESLPAPSTLRGPVVPITQTASAGDAAASAKLTAGKTKAAVRQTSSKGRYAKKASAKKVSAKKTSARQTSAKRSSAKKATSSRTAAKKSAAKKSASSAKKKSSGSRSKKR
jgi:murein DD-endopeptidase MepM/ murein hydrolase activator NlpD